MKTIDRIRKDPRVEDVFSEHGNIDPDRDDWWVWIVPGWCWDPETHTIREQTLTDCLKRLKSLTPCYCDHCKAAITEREKQKGLGNDKA